VAAGAVAFAIGSETWGSIVSPCTRTGATGLRPTFGRVSRHGAMALSWSMDKLGPIARSVEDCAIVLHAIAVPTAAIAPSSTRPTAGMRPPTRGRLRVGFVPALFEEEPEKGTEESHHNALQTLATLRSLGVELREMKLPDIPSSRWR
jgi:Asp-tRNA(Asn)/Glu-tRNA(Gln) amidotransferase A subunit family amidase